MRHLISCFYRVSCMILLMITLTGCGFHLRGMIEAPTWLNNVSIVSQQAHHGLESMLRMQLEANHIQLNPISTKAAYVLIIEKDDTQRNITSVSSSTTPRQYQLIYTVLFKLQNRQSIDIIPTTKIVVLRQVTINNDRILGSMDEQALTEREMRQDAVVQILNFINRHNQ